MSDISRLSASDDVVGQTLTINGTAFTVIGVAERQFFGTTVGVRGPDVWIPLVMQAAVRYAQSASSHDGADTRKPWPPQETIVLRIRRNRGRFLPRRQ
jgi:hypothetical protein